MTNAVDADTVPTAIEADTVTSALDVTIPQTMDLVLPTNEIIKVQMVDAGLWFGVNPLVFIASMMAVIAGMNLIVLLGDYCLERKRRNHELFDKRYPIYEAARNLLSIVTLQGQLSDQEIEEYRMEVLDADLLYSDGIRKYLMDLRDKAIEMKVASETDNYDKGARLTTELSTELTDRKLYAKLKPFLNLEQRLN